MIDRFVAEPLLVYKQTMIMMTTLDSHNTSYFGREKTVHTICSTVESIVLGMMFL